MKKIVSIIIAVMMILVAVPLTAMAADANADGYNDNDVAKISAFLKLSPDGVTNADKLGYTSADNPAAWTDVQWEISGGERRVTQVDWPYKDLGGPLDLSGCESLRSLECAGGSLESLNVSGCSALNYLNCYVNEISSLNLTGCGNLKELFCGPNELETLDVSGCTGLETMSCGGNRLQSLDISACTVIKYFEGYSNPLKSIHATINGAEETFNALDGYLELFYTDGVGYDHEMLIINARPVSLPFSGWAGTEGGAAYSYGQPHLNLTPGTSYNITASFASNPTYNDHDLIAMQTFLYNIPLEVQTNAGKLGYTDSDPSTWSGVTWDDSTTGKRLTAISWSNKDIAGDLDLSGCSSLKTVSCTNNAEIMLLDVSDCIALTSINWPDNDLYVLNADNCTALTSLNCTGNGLGMLDISDCTGLTQLSCADNQLKCIIANIGGTPVTLTSLGGGFVELAKDATTFTAKAAPYCMPFNGWTGGRDGQPFSSADAMVDLKTGTDWTLVTSSGYAILYDCNGATEGTAPDTDFDRYAKGDTALVYGNTGGLKRAGYTFTGWNTAANGSGTHYKADGKGELTMPAQDVTLYAEWTPVTYYISYDLDGGAASNPANYTVETSSFTLGSPTKQGYRFTGWSGTGITGTAMSVTIGKGSIGDRAYKANWVRNAFTVTFDAGNSVSSVSADGGSRISEPAAPLRSGYTFGGWYKEASCANAWNFSADAVTGDITLYAKWTPVKYSILYDLNGGNAVNPLSYTVESTSFMLSNPTRYGYNFAGWTGTGISGTAMSVTVTAGSTGDRVYTANWSEQGQSNYLAGVIPSSGSISPAFNKNKTSYNITIGENDTNFTLTPVKEYDGASMTINKQNAQGLTLPIANGKSVKFTVKVTLGKKLMTYTFTVTRPKSTNNALASLTAAAGTWSQPFDPNVTNYTLTLDENTKSTAIKAAAAAGKLASVSPVSAKVTLNNGQTKKVKITVKAQSGAKKVYTITVTRAASKNADLKSLKATGLTPGFNPAQTSYSVTLPVNKGSISISAKVAGYKAAVSIDGGKASKNVAVANGQTVTVRVAVTSQAGNKKEYVITVTRQ